MVVTVVDLGPATEDLSDGVATAAIGRGRRCMATCRKFGSRLRRRVEAHAMLERA
jgi:hypothetical protein